MTFIDITSFFNRIFDFMWNLFTTLDQVNLRIGGYNVHFGTLLISGLILTAFFSLFLRLWK